ncbi:GIY-YIG nuclease family protein [Clostridium sp. NSJ-6]|uniref:GIY-YIG nuclease family protein n=1 Tax=Clostridium hominis TaxID=2763036 RepID=A0ABR7DGW1_9CLOT|nr:GIY-YIG nuclease family protein [Clostridium hominis]MBC5630644.1 GIY-YIG nuclease family protein [Clostridium hominis]
MKEIFEELEKLMKVDANVGIYYIASKYKKFIYIGKSTNIKGRINKHMSDLRGNRHYNKGLQEAFNTIGRLFITSGTLINCNVNLLGQWEWFFINYFKENGFVVFGDRNTKKKYSYEIDGFRVNYDEYVGLTMLDDKYLIILDEYKRDRNEVNSTENDIYSRCDYTNFLMDELTRGLSNYKNDYNYNIKNILNEYITNDVLYINCSFNYIAYNIILNINEKLERKITDKLFMSFSLCSNEMQKLCRPTFIENVIFRIKKNYNMNNDLLRWLTLYVSNINEDILSMDFMEKVRYLDSVNRSTETKIHNLFDFAYNLILTIYCETIFMKVY